MARYEFVEIARVVSRVAVLGGGIMGTATALFLARRGVQVVVIDAAARPMDRASRWNEGKIHLGYLYAGDPSLDTARRVLPGGLTFKPLVESLISHALDDVTTTHDDTFLIHCNSVVDLETTGRYFDAVTQLVGAHPHRDRYLVPLDSPSIQRLSKAELNHLADPTVVVGGFRVPERSVETTWVADRLAAALGAEPGIELRMGTRVTGVDRDDVDRFAIRTNEGIDGPFDAVVNALWEGRLAIDATMGVPPPRNWSHRYRVAAFVRTDRVIDVPSAVICTGPFGDVKNYDGRNFYLSWYPTGLLIDSSSLAPAAPSHLEAASREQLATTMLTELAARIPRVHEIAARMVSCHVEGGWVYAAGTGSLADAASTLHRRDRIGASADGRYISVDTGKYSIAPWLAQQIASDLTT